MKVVTAEQMRRIEEDCGRIGLPADVLMENAGRAVAEEVVRIVEDIVRQQVLILIGPGNNGGDGLVVARYLSDWGAAVNVYLLGRRLPDDSNLKLVKQRNLACVEASEDEKLDVFNQWLSSATVVVDALFGTGKSRPLSDGYVKVLDAVAKARERQPGLRIVALDLPSGLDADSGAADPACLNADNTITLGFPKPGLFNAPGAERAGKITVADIGIPSHLAEPIATELISDQWARSVLPDRPLWANKGSFGKVLVVAGSTKYIGAAYLACSGAMRIGAGLVTLATVASLLPVLAAKLTEVTYLPLPETESGSISAQAVPLIQQEIGNYDVLLLGCGLGQDRSVTDFVESLLRLWKPELPLVLDADALNILAKVPDWWQQMAGDAILTPHPGELSRLTGTSVAEVQSDRIGIARKVAREWQKAVVLKGAYTVIATPDGQTRISPVANSGLASAGTGDVLAGIIAGLVAQGVMLSPAAACGVYLHGRAGDIIKDRIGDAGMIASDLLPALPLVIKQLKATWNKEKVWE